MWVTTDLCFMCDLFFPVLCKPAVNWKYIVSIIDELNTSKEQWWDDIDRENPKY